MKTDTDSIKVDVTAFKNDLLKVKADVAKVDNKVEIIDKKFTKEIVQVKGDIRTVRQKVASHEDHIAALEENFDGLRSEVDNQIAAASSNLRNQSGNGHSGQLNNNFANFATQARYQAAIALSNNPGIIFSGVLIEWIPFITQFKNNFENVINDNSALFSILLRHLKGEALESIRSCVFNAEGKDQYKQALKILNSRYGQKLSVIRAHKTMLLNGKTVSESINDFTKLGNELSVFCAVLKHFNVGAASFSEEVVKNIVSSRLTPKMCVEFTNFMRNSGKLENTDQYLDELLKWVNGKISFWQSSLGSNLLPKHNYRNVCAVTAEHENSSMGNNARVNNFRNSPIKGFLNRGNGKFNGTSNNRPNYKNTSDYNNNRTFETSGNKYCAYCGEIGHTALDGCNLF